MASQHLCPCCSLCEDQPPVSGFDLCRSCLNGIEGKSQTEPPTSVTSVLGSILESDQVPDSVASDLSHLSTVLASSAPSASSDWKSPFNRPYKDVFVSSLSRSSPFAPPIVSRSTAPAAVGSEREARRAAAMLEPSSSSSLSFHLTAFFRRFCLWCSPHPSSLVHSLLASSFLFRFSGTVHSCSGLAEEHERTVAHTWGFDTGCFSCSFHRGTCKRSESQKEFGRD